MFDLGSLLLQDARLCPAHCRVELRMVKMILNQRIQHLWKHSCSQPQPVEYKRSMTKTSIHKEPERFPSIPVFYEDYNLITFQPHASQEGLRLESTFAVQCWHLGRGRCMSACLEAKNTLKQRKS